MLTATDFDATTAVPANPTSTSTVEIPATEAPVEMAIIARNLTKVGRRGNVYGPIDLDLPVGSLSLVSGPDGSGKTSLLLTLVARMTPTRASELTVLGETLPRGRRRVQRRSAAVGIAGLDSLDEVVSVAATIRERQAWLAPWWQLVKHPGDAEVKTILGPYYGGLDTPNAKTTVQELSGAQNLLLRIALAMLSRPQLLVVDQIDQLHDIAERDQVWRVLHHLATGGVTVVTSATSPHEAKRIDLGFPVHHLDLSK